MVFFVVLNIILPNALISPPSLLQTQQVVTSQIRSHIDQFVLIL